MVRKQTRCKNQIKSILCFYGIHIPEELANSHWSKRFISWIETIRMERASGNTALKVHLAELMHIRQSIADLNRAIRKLAATDDYRNNVQFLKTVPGISDEDAQRIIINRPYMTLSHLVTKNVLSYDAYLAVKDYLAVVPPDPKGKK